MEAAQYDAYYKIASALAGEGEVLFIQDELEAYGIETAFYMLVSEGENIYYSIEKNGKGDVLSIDIHNSSITEEFSN